MELNKNATAEPKADQRNLDLSHWAANWIWRAVQCLIEAPDFNPSPKWAAQRLNVSIEKVVDAFDGLERLGIIQRVDGTFKVKSDWFQVTPKESAPEKLLLAQAKVTQQILSKLQPTDKYTVQFFRGDNELLNKYAPKFMELYKAMNEEGKQKGLKEVIASEISFAVLTSESNNGGVQ